MNKKRKKQLIAIIFVISIINLIFAATNKSYGIIGEVVGVLGLATIFVMAIQVIMLAIGVLLQGLMTGLTAGGEQTVSGLRSIFFNHNPLTTAAYFANGNNTLGLDKDALWQKGNVMFDISGKITEYYYVLRNLSIAILLFVLLYIAIRMATSTISSDEAKYKKMLTNWAVSLALVFVLHFIMIVTFYINNTLVSILEKTIDTNVNADYGQLLTQALVPFTGFGEALVFLMIIGMEITFLFMYIKRVIVLGFLILIAPLITITYSIDKIGDGKSQALNTWLKEFIYNVIIQPFHCILYITMICTTVNAMGSSDNYNGLGGFIVYFIILQFVREAEEIIKKIFNIQAGSMPGMKNMGALALGVMSTFGKASSSAKNLKSKKMPKMKEDAGKKVKTVNAQTGSAASVANAANTSTNNSTSNSGNNAAAQAANAASTQGMATQTSSSAGSSTNVSENVNNVVPVAVAETSAQTSASQQTKFKKAKAKGLNDFKAGIVGTAKFFGGPDVSAKDIAIKAAKLGATAAATGLGLGVGDVSQGVGFGMTAYGASDSIHNAIASHKNNLILEQNEEQYDKDYEEYVREYKRLVDANASESDIRENLVGLFESYDNGNLNLDSLANKDEIELKRKFLKDSYSKLKKSYEVTGGEKPADLVKARTQNYSSDKYVAKYGK